MSEPSRPAPPPPPAPGGDEQNQAAVFLMRLQATALSLLVIVLLVFLLREFAAVLQPFFIAIFIAYLIVPAHRWLVRRRVPPPLSYVSIVAVVLGAAVGLGQLVYSSFRDFERRLPEYEQRLGEQAKRLAENVPMLDRQRLDEILEAETQDPRRWVQLGGGVAGGFIQFVSATLVVALFLVFILAEQGLVERRVRKAFRPERAEEILGVARKINASIASYISVKTLMSFLTGLLTALVLLAFGVDFAIMWGVITFLANFIPYVGSLVAVLLPVAQSAVQFEQLWVPVALLALLTGVQQFIGLFLEPVVAGQRLDLSPLVIVLSLAFWGVVWGIPGMILAVPLVVIVKTVLDNIPATAPAGHLLSKV